MIDTHCHLTRPELGAHLEQHLSKAAEVGVHHCITVATTTSDSLAARDLAETHPQVLCTAGVHPLHAAEPIDWSQMERAARSPRCVAWGELGLDYHYSEPAREIQHTVLHEQLSRIKHWQLPLAQGGAGISPKPVVIHCRKAVADLIPILRDSGLPAGSFVFHCFNEGPAEAAQILDFGAWISFTGILTYGNAPQVRQAAAILPRDRVMVETDAPWLTPEPHRGKWPNCPANVCRVAQCLATIWGAGERETELQLDSNAVNFFGDLLAPN